MVPWSREVSMRFPTRMAFILVPCLTLLLSAMGTHAVELQTELSAEYEMSVLLEEDLPPWDKIGGGATILLPDGSLLINDNRGDDKIGYETLLGRIHAQNRVIVSARLKALSNFDGRGAVMEISRPGLQVGLRFFPDHMTLVERTESGDWRWLASVSVDLFHEFHEVALEKTSSAGDDGERARVYLDGVLVADVLPRGDSLLPVGRVIIGALSRPSLGASIWDWMRYDLDGVAKALPSEETSFGSLKANFGSH